MPYTPNAEDLTQPTGNQALSTAAPEFRTLKAYIQATKAAQAVRDTAQDAATALVASNLADAVAAQDIRDDAQDTAIGTAQGTATTALSAASAAQVDATAALAAAALSVVKVKSIVSLTSGSGNIIVPAGATQCLVIGKGGDRQGSSTDNFASTVAATKALVIAVTAGDILNYSIAVAAGDDFFSQATTFSSVTCEGAPRLASTSGATVGWTASAGWLVLVFY